MRAIRYGREYMILHDDGSIERANWKPSDKWKVTGAVERNNFGRVVRCYSLAEILNNPAAIPWKFKNGKQRVFICDIDHGTRREWGSPSHYIY